MGGAAPVGVGASGNTVGVLAVESVEGAKEGLRFGFASEQEHGAQDACEAEVVVVHGPEPRLRPSGELWGALDDDAGGCRNLGEPVEAHHALERLAQAILDGERAAEGLDGGRIEDGCGGIGAAGLGKREEPLDEVVDGFEAVIVPGEDLTEGAALVVACAVAVEGDQRIGPGGRQR